ncbi:MAG: 3-isopropylmalate dehydratase large subunit [Chitinispirillaceae bacterium]|nr:3-isopropylmalate dehydratase large subunit [Chitinispirillaceae bacterium]
MSGKNLFNKIWDLHKVATLPTGQEQLFIGLHLIHEVTSPQAFAMIKEKALPVRYPSRTFATVDHIIPTADQTRPLSDPQAEKMLAELERNTKENGITFFGTETGSQGIVHIIGPEQGLTQPGMTIACGDSHTSTHGAFGTIALGIGTSQVRDILATQTLAINRPKVRRITISGNRDRGVYAKDIILKIISILGVKGGIGYAYEYAGDAIEALSMEERMTLCNMSIEGGARVGYVNPDATTFDYLKGRPFVPAGDTFDRAVEFWRSIASDADASFDDTVKIDINGMAPMVTWGINPGQAIEVTERIPDPAAAAPEEREVAQRALDHMGFSAGDTIAGKKIDVAFLGSCTNGRLSDLREAAAIVKGNKIAPHVQALVVPGSQKVKVAAEAEGLDQVFRDAGFSWRLAGCSMCLAMNPDKLKGRQLCASSSNRNFIGRQGSPGGRTLLMSPAMVAAAAVAGEVIDVRKYIV